MGKRDTTVRQVRGDQGVFTVSLDFELYWGVRDKTDLESYKANLLGARNVIPQLLERFAKAGVHATWATVGFLFFDDKDELLAHLPPLRPRYRDRNLSPYDHVLRIGPNERRDPFHYARSLIRRILQFPGQEIGSHTFSHYYCLEEGQTVDEFRADLRAAHRAAQQLGIVLKSLVFPRNQWRPEYLSACAEAGIRVVRGPRQSWMYQPKAGADTAVKRAFRLADTYVSLSGHNAGRPLPCQAGLVNVPSSRFLRPFSPRLARLTPLLLRRIRASMRHAARNGLTYHLWWHPHNFGIYQEQNLDILQMILHYFGQLAQEHGMMSRSMGELVAQDDPAAGDRARGWSREPALGAAAVGRQCLF
jgi:peptidoglycan/xylan/chitin deacetylase (PgdA/CDA1 family)